MKLKTNGGRLTSYGLACGYLDIFQDPFFGTITLHKPSPSFPGYEVYENASGYVRYAGPSLTAARKAARGKHWGN